MDQATKFLCVRRKLRSSAALTAVQLDITSPPRWGQRPEGGMATCREDREVPSWALSCSISSSFPVSGTAPSYGLFHTRFPAVFACSSRGFLLLLLRGWSSEVTPSDNWVAPHSDFLMLLEPLYLLPSALFTYCLSSSSHSVSSPSPFLNHFLET